MKLTGKYRIVIEGEVDTFRAASTGHSGLEYLLNRLFSGQEVAEKNLETWGLRVIPEPGGQVVSTLRALTPDDMETVWERGYVDLPIADNEAALEFLPVAIDAFVEPRQDPE